MLKRLVGFLTAAGLCFLILAWPGTAFAASGLFPEESQYCSLTLNFVPNGKPASGVVFALHRVADVLPDQMTFQELEDYDYNVLANIDLTWSEKAKMLAGFVERDSKTASEIDMTDAQGRVCFTNLEKGIYLVVGTSTGDLGGFVYTPAPFLVTLPGFSPDRNDWSAYDVIANVKSYTSGQDIDYTSDHIPLSLDERRAFGPSGSLEISDVPQALTEVQGAASDDSGPLFDSSGMFAFDIELKASDGSALEGEYLILKPPGILIGKVIDGAGSFRLDAGQTFMVLNLPDGARYELTERPSDGWEPAALFGTAGTASSDAIPLSVIVNGRPGGMPEDLAGAELPVTGGVGTGPYVAAGCMAVLAAAWFAVGRRRRP